MAGTIVADTLTHSTAGSIATNYVVNGSAKVWCHFNGITNTTLDSLNISSITDNGIGEYTYNINNSHNNAYYSLSGSGQRNSAQPAFTHLHFGPAGNNSLLTGSVRCVFPYNSGSVSGDIRDADAVYALMTTHGDLA